MELTDRIWQELEGGYRAPYDASIALKELEQTDSPEQLRNIWDELWNELHHQGDVGLASYLALPQLVRIGIEKGIFDWNLLGLCAVIEQQRHLGTNPDLPIEFREYYHDGLERLRTYIISKLGQDLDQLTLTYALSGLATCNGEIKLGKAILMMEDESLLDEFLEGY